MKATELRIGNYVYGINRRSEIHIPITEPLKVLQIELFNTEVLPLDKNPATVENWFKITNEDLLPNPLTEEWLLKFGFYEFGFYEFGGDYTKEYNINHDFKTYFDLEKWKDGWGVRDYDIIIKYVHQLQNLYFVLTGEELKYE